MIIKITYEIKSLIILLFIIDLKNNKKIIILFIFFKYKLVLY